MSCKTARLEHAGKRKLYLTAVSGALIGYLLFFTSALWFPGQKKSMEYTPPGVQQEIGETACMVSVVYWAYAPSQRAMSVELDLDGTFDDVRFSAVDKARDTIPVEIKLSQSGTYVLELSAVPENFQAISLRVTVQGETLRLYTNEEQVERVDTLVFYPNLNGYYQARIRRNIVSLEEEIEEQKIRIQDLTDQIADYQIQITQTSERLPYLSRQQRTDAEASIETWKTQIGNCREKQKEANDRIMELTDEQEKQKELLDEPGMDDQQKIQTEEPASFVSDSDTQEQESEGKE